jgi:predicted DNA-binding WGR domain protein
MATRYFELSDGKSHKFWEIRVEGTSHTVRYGRIGTNGTTKTKDFADAAAATADAAKLIEQKVKKGYEES